MQNKVSISSAKTVACKIECYESIPEDFTNAFSKINFNDEAFPFTIFIPEDTDLLTKRSAKLICYLKDYVYIFEKERTHINETSYMLKHISSIEKGTNLLHSWIKISGVSNTGLHSTTVTYNTVSRELFITFINLIRFSRLDVKKSTDIIEISKFEYLIKESLKFYNYSLDCVAENEHVLAHLYNPEMFSTVYKFFTIRISPAYMLMLTNSELILVSEEYAKRKHKGNYGMIVDFFTLNMLRNIFLIDDGKNENCILKIVTKDGLEYAQKLSADYRPKVLHIIDLFSINKGAHPMKPA